MDVSLVLLHITSLLFGVALITLGVELLIRYVGWKDQKDSMMVTGKVTELILEHGLVKVIDDDGRSYMITRRAGGMDMDFFREGDTLEMKVSRQFFAVLEVDLKSRG